MQSDLPDSKIFPNSPSFPMENLLSSSLQNSTKQPDPSLKLKDFDQSNLLAIPGSEKNNQAQPEVYASFRNPENENTVNNESKESEIIKDLKEEDKEKTETQAEVEASIELKKNLEEGRKIVQSREKMENDTIKFKSDTIQEDTTSVRPETKQQQKNNSSIEMEIKVPQENVSTDNKEQNEDPILIKETEKEGTLTLLPIGSPKKNEKPVQNQKQPQIKANNIQGRISHKQQKTFAEDSRLNRSALESRGDRYQEEPKLKFLDWEKHPEPRKKNEPSKEFRPFHLAKGNPGKNRNASLPPLNNNKGGEESITPSEQNISRGSFMIAGNFQSANVSCIESQYNRDNTNPNDDESVDLTRLNNILRAKLKPGSRAKLVDDAVSDKEDSDNFIPKLFEKFMNKNNGKVFANNVGNTPYMDHLPNKGRGFSAKRVSDRYITKGKNANTSIDKRPNLTENYNSDEESSTLMHSRNLQRIYDKVNGTPEEVPPRLNTSENRTRNIKRVYNPAYLDKKLPKNNVQSTLKATLNAKNTFTLGAASNLIKPEVQPIQEKPKPKARAVVPAKTHLTTPSNNNPWDSMMSDKSKATPSSTTTNMAKKRSSSVIGGDAKGGGGQLTTNGSGILTPKKSYKNLSHSRSGSAEKLFRMDSKSLVRQAYRVKTNIGKEESRENSANRSTTDALNATRNYINKLMKNNKRGDSFDYHSSFERKGGVGFAKAERNPTGLVLEDTSPGPAYNLSSCKGILGTEKGLNLKDSSPTRKATENNRSNSKANLHSKGKEVVLLINSKAVKTFQSQNGSEKSNNLTDRNKTAPKGVPFGKAKRDPLFGGLKEAAPGPGNYDLPKTKQNTAAATFGKEKREPLLKLKL